MNGRGGSVSLDGSGGWSSGGGSSLPQNLRVDSRSGNQPSEYKASYSIEFTPGFESGGNDEFSASITTDNGSGGSGGSTGGTGNGTIEDNDGYRYGFNGKEQDPEVSGTGNQYDYGFRIYNPRLGRFLSVDPLTKSYPWYTPYQFAGNMPTIAIDLDGMEAKIVTVIHGTQEREILRHERFDQKAVKVENGHWEIHQYYNFSTGKAVLIKEEKLKVITEVKSPVGTINLSNASVIYGSVVSAEFRTKATGVAANLSMDANNLMAIMAFETGGSFSPSKKNAAGSSGTGLIQFMASTAEKMGTTTEALAKMIDVEQLDYVEKYLSAYKGKMTSLEDAYMAVLWPAAIGKESDYVLWDKDSEKKGIKLAYKQNAGLDTDGDGKVTKAEVSTVIKKVYERGEKKKN